MRVRFLCVLFAIARLPLARGGPRKQPTQTRALRLRTQGHGQAARDHRESQQRSRHAQNFTRKKVSTARNRDRRHKQRCAAVMAKEKRLQKEFASFTETPPPNIKLLTTSPLDPAWKVCVCLSLSCVCVYRGAWDTFRKLPLVVGRRLAHMLFLSLLSHRSG
jgi:hypothetical protein